MKKIKHFQQTSTSDCWRVIKFKYYCKFFNPFNVGYKILLEKSQHLILGREGQISGIVCKFFRHFSNEDVERAFPMARGMSGGIPHGTGNVRDKASSVTMCWFQSFFIYSENIQWPRFFVKVYQFGFTIISRDMHMLDKRPKWESIVHCLAIFLILYWRMTEQRNDHTEKIGKEGLLTDWKIALNKRHFP